MKSIFIPHPNKKRVLIIVDVQQGFSRGENSKVIESIKHVILNGGYDLFVEATFHAEKDSLWDKQTGWIFKYEPTISEIGAVLPKERTISVIKTTKSVFAEHGELFDKFRNEGIEEVHLVGFDTNDCVLASAFDSFDAGFFTYVLEEGTGSSNGESVHEYAIAILRHVDMTNHSELITDKNII